METIHCRIKRSLWWIPILGAGEALFILIAPLIPSGEPPKNPIWPVYIIVIPVAALMLWGVGYAVLSLLREEVIADDSGLRWRGAFGPWKSARWDEISDFYLSHQFARKGNTPGTQKPSATMPVVETPSGPLKVNRALTHLGELLPLIAARALNAPARDWEIWGFRPAQNWSRRFTYWTKTRQWEAIWMSGNIGFLWIAALWTLIFSPKKAPIAEDWQWMWLPWLFMVALFGSFGIGSLFGVWSLWRDRNFCRKHRRESVELSLAGIHWSNGEAELRSDWSQIQSVVWVAGRGPRGHYRVQTAQGDFPVWVALENISSWVSLMRHFAPQLHFQTPYEAQRARISTRWSHSSQGESARIFGFRGHEMRTFLLFPLVLSWLPLLLRQTGTPDGSPPLALPLALGCALIGTTGTGYGLWCERSAAIWVDEKGLKIHFPLRAVRRIAWSEIEALGRDERGAFLRVDGQKARLLRGLEPLVWNELRAFIAARATNATGHFD